MISFAHLRCGDGCQEPLPFFVQIETVKNGGRNARLIDDVDVPLGCTKTLGKVCLDIVLQDGQLVFSAQVRDAFFGTRQVDQDNLRPTQFGAVVIDDVLELRSLRMTVWSGGLREVDNENRAQEFISRAFGTECG